MGMMDLAPPEVRGGMPRLVLTGREEVLIEGHRGLLSYETDCVRVRSGMGLVTVAGTGLTIGFFGTEDLLIRGRVQNISVSEEDR